MKRLTILAAGLLLPVAAVRAEPSQRTPQVGDTYEIMMNRESSRESSDGFSKSSTHDTDVIVERVVGVRTDGLELEYDLPASATPEQRASDWHFPVRVFKPTGGSYQLLNRPELETRLDAWLKQAQMTREACGHWIFTWNAFRIECDPDAVIGTLEAFDLTSTDAHPGAAYQAHGARGFAPLARKSVGPDGSIYEAVLEVDPDAVRSENAQSDVVVGEIMNKPVTLEAALRARAEESVSGTITVTLEADPDGTVRKRTSVTRLETSEPGGPMETATITQTVERRFQSRR